MLRLIDYICSNCEYTFEELEESKKASFTVSCPKCQGIAIKQWEVKNNLHRARIRDQALGKNSPLYTGEVK